MDGNQWKICERPSYSSDEELIESFIVRLTKALQS